MDDETKKFHLDDNAESGDDLDALIRSTREEIDRVDRMFSNEAPVQPPEPPHEPPQRESYVSADPLPEDDEEEPSGMPGWLKAVLYAVCVLAASALLGLGIWLCADDVCGFTKPDTDVEFSVSETDTLNDVIDHLDQVGLVRYRWLFKLYAQVSHAEKKITAGTYVLNHSYDYHALVGAMSSNGGMRATVSVTIPEGYECSRIFALLAENKVCTEEALYDAAANADFDYAFLEGLKKGDENRLEGYLFPDTYEFYVGDDPENVLTKFLRNFDKKVTDDLRAEIDALNKTITNHMRANGFSEEEIAAGQMDLGRVIIVASLIEKEAQRAEERATVASVIYNRLCSKDYPLLQIDATIQYVLDERKETLTLADQAIDNPYNTYKYKGLTPGAIANPGLASIKAALDPDATDYYFYALDEDGSHHFSKTYYEHQQFLESQKDEQ
ncbi:MAG: endolytic transglycosylase MltG [Oscillospiraceae bacterium]|nr:endolytic transglycosylase MltG [Oscillospiraceae bacterium]